MIPVVEPALESFEPQVREQLVERRRHLDSLLADGKRAPAELAAAYGEMGQLYYLYEVTEPALSCFQNTAALAPNDFRWPYFLGLLLELDGRREEAAGAFEDALERRPDYAPAHLRLSRAYLDLGRLAAAEVGFRAALELDPATAAAHLGLGQVARSRGDLEGAIEQFERTLELQPQADAVHHHLGMAYRALGDIDRARYHLALNRGHAVHVFDPLVDGLTARIKGAQIHFRAALEALRTGDRGRGMQQLRLALAADPDDFLVHYNLGMALLESGRTEEGVAELEAAVQINPEYSNAHFNLGTVAAQQGRFQEAVGHYAEAHRLDPEDELAYLEWATALSRVGRKDQAISALERLLSRSPGQPRALLNLGLLLSEAGRDVEARRRLSEVLDLEVTERVSAHVALAALAERQGELGTALDHYRRAVELEPDSSEVRLALAAALGRGSRFADAAETYSAVLTLDPGSLDAHFGRAMALMLGRSYLATREALERALEVFPENAALSHVLARLLATCPDPAVREGPRALALALAVFESHQSLEHAETVAMALAEEGRFQEAANWERRVVGEAQREGRADLVARAALRLATYERQEPVRAPWLD